MRYINKKLQELSQIHGAYIVSEPYRKEKTINEELYIFRSTTYYFQDAYKLTCNERIEFTVQEPFNK
jgi:hypothetical protein